MYECSGAKNKTSYFVSSNTHLLTPTLEIIQLMLLCGSLRRCAKNRGVSRSRFRIISLSL